MYVDKKLLRSGNEIAFFQILSEIGLQHKLDFNIEMYYDNSLMRDDFYLVKGDLHIEICGFKTDPDYVDRMNYKKDTFGSVLLWNQKEYRPFIMKYFEDYYESND